MGKQSGKLADVKTIKSQSKNLNLKLSVLIFVLSFFQYSNTFQNQYAWDDNLVITDNARVQKGIAGIPDLFLKYNSKYKSDQYGYRPIVLSSFAIDYQLFGLNPKAGHIINVFWFSLLCVVLYNVLRKIFFRFSELAPLLITMLFLVHPIHVEVVANIKSRDEIFSLLFSLISLFYLMKYQDNLRVKNLVISAAVFLLAFLSKESAVTFLFVMLLTICYRNDWKLSKQFVLPSIAIAMLFIIALAIVKVYTGSQLGVASSQGAGIYYENSKLGNSFMYTGDFSIKLANAFTVLVLYLKNFFLPFHLVYYYGYNQVPVAAWSDVLVIISCILHITLAVIAFLNLRKHAAISYGIFSYFISISFYTHLVTPLADTMADRFYFTPSLFFITFLVFAICRLLNIDIRKPLPGNFKVNSIKSFFDKKPVAFVLILLMLSITTFARNKVWKDDFTLISNDMPALENCSRAHYYYANLIKGKLMQVPDAAMEHDMIFHFNRSIEISDSAYYSYMALGTYYCDLKRFNEGIPVLTKMAALFPNQADPHYYLGQALYQTGSLNEGIAHLEKSLTLAPEVSITYYDLALAYAKNDEFNRSLDTLKTMEQKFQASMLLFDAYGKVFYQRALKSTKDNAVNSNSIEDDMKNSTAATLKCVDFGGDPKLVYSQVIGRYQTLNDNENAKRYYNDALSKGILQRQ